MSKKRIEITTSRTSEWTCVSRAASALETDPHYHGDDLIALQLIPGFLRILLYIPLVRRIFTRTISPKGIYEYIIARTKYIDDIFTQSLANGFDQILIFGAGFDTRALRFCSKAESTILFELDVALTQTAKRGRYTEKGLNIPANVHFIAIDFDRESLSEKLEQAGFATGKKTLFVLEGLLMYLHPESVHRTFREIEELSGKGSELVFDYVRLPVLTNPDQYYGGKQILQSVAKAGEQWLFGLDEEKVIQFLDHYGLSLMEHKTPAELEKMYFTDAAGALAGRINGTHCLVRAARKS